MLVLERSEGEWLEITTPSGVVIKVQVVKIHGSRVQVGIAASSDYKIERFDLD